MKTNVFMFGYVEPNPLYSNTNNYLQAKYMKTYYILQPRGLGYLKILPGKFFTKKNYLCNNIITGFKKVHTCVCLYTYFCLLCFCRRVQSKAAN